MASAALGTTFRHLRELFNAGSVLGLEDGQLLARYSGSGDPAAFEALVSRHGPMVLATCRGVLRNEHDAEDAFQATFLVLARKAGSIRRGETLGGWLHRVACRSSVQAGLRARKRRRIEEAAAMVRAADARPDSDERLALLHEEIDRLPESQRLPVVLCDLEGLSYDQAAQQLGWTLPSLRHRLSDARRKLKGRLARRDAWPTALAPKAVPPALTKAVIASATGGLTTTGVTLLSQVVLKGMFMTRIRWMLAASLAAVAVGSAGLRASGGGPPVEGPKPPSNPRMVAREPLAVGPTLPEVVEVRGLVVAPDGSPVAGALVTPTHYDYETKPYPEATTALDGRFSIRIPRSKRQEGVVDREEFPWLLASKAGFGPGWARAILKGGEPTIRLVEAGPPIEGRLVDLEGRPVAGARVSTRQIYFARGQGDRSDEIGDLSGWAEMARKVQDHHPRQGLSVVPTGPLAYLTTTTALDGRFTLRGVGRERVADMLVSSPTVVTTRVLAMTRDLPEIRAVEQTLIDSRNLVFHSPKFEDALAPCKPIRGVARDAETGQPLAGLSIKGAVYNRQRLIESPGIEATTDVEGRYTLTGLPGAPAFAVFVTPGPGQPYTKATLKATADSPATEPANFDLNLKRGVVLRGRVTDKATGRPVPGWVNAFTFEDSPSIAQYPGYAQSHRVYSYLDPEGRYEVVVPPGRTLVACRSDMDRYLVGVGADAIPGYDPKFNPNFSNFRVVPTFQGVANYHALASIDLKPETPSTTLDIQVDPGRSLELTAIDPEGRPIGGTQVRGTRDQFREFPVLEASPTFEIHSLAKGRPRRVTVTHEGRKLVGSIWLDGTEEGRREVRLGPWGTIEGRILDNDGNPARNRGLSGGNPARPTGPEEIGILPGGSTVNLTTDQDGRFRVEGLVPGLSYSTCVTDGELTLGDLFKDVTVAPGEVKDLGDLKVLPFRR